MEDLPDYNQALEQWEEMVKRFNDRYSEGAELNNKLSLLNAIELRKSFDNYSKYDIKRARGIITLSSRKKQYSFDIMNYAKLLEDVGGYGKKIIVDIHWNEQKADIWYEGKYIDTLEKCKKSHNTIAEYTEETKEALKIQKEKKHRFISQAEQKRQDLKGIGETLKYTSNLKVYKENPKDITAEQELYITNEIVKNKTERKFKRK